MMDTMTEHDSNKKKTNSHDCSACRSHFADLLLDETYATANPDLSAHLADCQACGTELAELHRTFNLLGDWTAPEPSPYFDVRLHARLREEQQAAPEGFWERTRAFFLFSTGRAMRPALAGAFGFVLLVGGGTFAGFYQHAAATQASATVNDLKILDNNAQALQQMEQLLDDSSSEDGNAPPTT